VILFLIIILKAVESTLETSPVRDEAKFISSLGGKECCCGVEENQRWTERNCAQPGEKRSCVCLCGDGGSNDDGFVPKLGPWDNLTWDRVLMNSWKNKYKQLLSIDMNIEMIKGATYSHPQDECPLTPHPLSFEHMVQSHFSVDTILSNPFEKIYNKIDFDRPSYDIVCRSLMNAFGEFRKSNLKEDNCYDNEVCYLCWIYYYLVSCVCLDKKF
jgi:hypothetical protein